MTDGPDDTFHTDNAVAATAELIDDAARDRLVLVGPDAGAYLQSQISQEVRDLEVGAARWTLVLDPTGKVEVLARLRRSTDDTYELDTDAGFGAAMEARLRRFMIRVAIETEFHDAAAAEPSDEVESRRVEAGWPRMGREIVSGTTIPATTGVVPMSVNFAKGCYPGQELVERMDSRGADAPKRLRVVEVDDAALAGDPVVVDGVEVGTLTSVSPTASLAIASVKRGVDVGRSPMHLAV